MLVCFCLVVISIISSFVMRKRKPRGCKNGFIMRGDKCIEKKIKPKDSVEEEEEEEPVDDFEAAKAAAIKADKEKSVDETKEKETVEKETVESCNKLIEWGECDKSCGTGRRYANPNAGLICESILAISQVNDGFSRNLPHKYISIFKSYCLIMITHALNPFIKLFNSWSIP